MFSHGKMVKKAVFNPYPTLTYPTSLIHMFLFFLQVLRKESPSFNNLFKGEGMMQSYPPRALDRRLREDWAKDSRESPRVLMSLRVDFGAMG